MTVHERIRRFAIAGMACCLAGSAQIAAEDPHSRAYSDLTASQPAEVADPAHDDPAQPDPDTKPQATSTTRDDPRGVDPWDWWGRTSPSIRKKMGVGEPETIDSGDPGDYE